MSRKRTEKSDRNPDFIQFARAVFSLQGAHIMEYTPAGEAPVLWMSRESCFTPGKALRGGVPVCFPWFGANESDPSLPAHGYARTSVWTLESAERRPDGTDELIFTWQSSWWKAEYRAIVGKTLELELKITNISAEKHYFEEALHSYFDISDISRVYVSGLEGRSYTDKLTGSNASDNSVLRIDREVDRIYRSGDTCVICDEGRKRRIVVEKENSASTVVWNPWVAKSRRMSDFGDNEYHSMLCVESGNVKEDKVCVEPDGEHLIRVKISVADL